MVRKLSRVLILVAGLFVALPAQAANGWYAFLYNGISRQIVRVDADGAQEVFSLGLADTVFLGSGDLAFSPDGGRVAFCANSASAETPQGDTVLIVRDLPAQANVLEVPLGGNIGCRVSGAGFNADASQVAVSVVAYFPGDPAADTSGPIWRLLVVDVASGSIISEINADSAPVIEAGVIGGVALLPEVRAFANNQIIFAEVPYGIGGAPEWNAFIWQLDTGTINPDATGRWGKSGLSYLDATGELAWVDYDPNLPAVEPGGPMPASNIVKVADASGTERVIYQTTDWVLVDTQFINGGQQLGVLLLSSFDPENPDAQESRWIALGRDGSVTELASGAVFSQIAAAPDGYVLFELNFSDDFSQQDSRLSVVANGTVRRLWESQEQGWEFAGAVGAPLATMLVSFPAAQP
jgi:hypothetical protein